MAGGACLSSSSFTYDVFLSFRGLDTRFGFTGNLYKALCDKGIHTFIDDEELERGNEITPSLIKAIQDSRIAIVVLSKSYADSSFCLDELSTILDYVKANGRLVLPVFYDVDPSHVRHHRGAYGEALAKHAEMLKANNNDIMEKLEKWKMALKQVADLSGSHFKHGCEYEHKFISKIVEEVSRKINRIALSIPDYLVGLESQIQKINLLLDVGSNSGVRVLGIHGMGGIGKTMLAMAVYNSIADHFQGICFLQNVRENYDKHGLQYLQKTILSKIVGEKFELSSTYEGMSIIQKRLKQKKVLLILDDVDKQDQLNAIVGKYDWFGHGSRVIITTRDKHLLESHKVEITYEVVKLSKTDASKLLRWKAFKCGKVDPSYVGVLNDVVTYASGLPLALEVIGSNLIGKNVDDWKSALYQYKRIPNIDIQNILKISFDALEECVRKIFLNIACFFKGCELTIVQDMLQAHHDGCIKYHIGVLVDRSLIKIQGDRVTLHDLIEGMAKNIVLQESPDLGKRSRLWSHEDIIHVLKQNEGTSKIQIMILDPPYDVKERGETVDWDRKAFKKMKNLKTLIIRNICFSHGPKHLPNSLRVLEWKGYPSHSLPIDFHPEKLTIVKLSSSCLKSLSFLEKHKFMNMKVLKLDSCYHITHIPDVSGIPNLEEMSFRQCHKLIKLDDSVGFLYKLKFLEVTGCTKLGSFPPIKLTSLESLRFSRCDSLEMFPEILGKMENIHYLYLDNTPIKELPDSIQNLVHLQQLYLLKCGKVRLPSSFVMLPEIQKVSIFGSLENEGTYIPIGVQDNISDDFFPTILACISNLRSLVLEKQDITFLPALITKCCSLTTLYFEICNYLQEIRWIPPNLEELSAIQCPSLRKIDLTGLSGILCLRKVILDGCYNLQDIRGIPPNLTYLSAENCKSLNYSCRSMLLNYYQVLHEEGGHPIRRYLCMPGSRIPEWFEHYSKGQSFSFWFRGMFPAISLCFVLSGEYDYIYLPILNINGNETDAFSENEMLLSEYIYIFVMEEINFIDDEILLQNEWNHVKISMNVKEPWICSFIQMGLHVFKQKCSLEDISFTDPYQIERDDDWDSNSMVSSTLMCSNTGGKLASGKRKIGALSLVNEAFAKRKRLDNEVTELLCREHPNAVLDSDSVMPSFVMHDRLDGVCTCFQWLECFHRLFDNSFMWNWISKAKIPLEVEFFICLAQHGALPTNYMRHNRGLSSSPFCSRCSGQEETILHILRDCPHAKEVWLRLGLCHIPSFYINEVTSWLFYFVAGYPSSLCFAAAWWLWCWRNHMCLGDQEWDTDEVIKKILCSKAHFDMLSIPGTSIPPVLIVSWNPPRNNWVKVNVDGSCLDEQRIGFGGVIRTSDGLWVKGFSCFAGRGDILLAELLAFRFGLLFAWDLGFRFLICESDSEEVMKSVFMETAESRDHAVVIEDIRTLLAREWQVDISLARREANATADCLAKWGSMNLLPLKIWDFPPLEVEPFLLADSVGVVHLP